MEMIRTGIDSRSFGIAAGAAAGIVFVLCAAAIAIAPMTAAAFFGYVMHADLAQIARAMTVGGFVVGLLFWSIGTGLVFGLGATIYNRLIRRS